MLLIYLLIATVPGLLVVSYFVYRSDKRWHAAHPTSNTYFRR